MVYAIARGFLTGMIVARWAGATTTSASVLFAVVLGSCIISAPFNEIRGFLLQSGGNKMTFQQFFKPANFVRSTSLGALNQAIALAAGYYLTPIVANVINTVHMALDAGDFRAFIAAVAFLDLVIFLISKSATSGGSASEEMVKKIERIESETAAKKAQIEKDLAEIEALKQKSSQMIATEALSKQIADLKDEIKKLPAKLKGK
mmetsp:Transcript_81057/g.208649  ORF Transcript_81057/g.208649 Transcript_81057/m.208649 type:complete len:204 (+) Transcript_81057:2-613(+)